MALAAALSTLLDEARAEAKRLGHPVATPLHLAAALARRHADEFEKVFSPGAAGRTLQELPRAVPAGTEADTLEVLSGADPHDLNALLVALQKKLATITPDLDFSASADGAGAASAEPTAPQSNGPPPARAEGLIQPLRPDAAIQGFDEVVTELVAMLAMHTPARPLLRGPAGCGKSSVPIALATRLSAGDYAGPLAGNAIVRLVTENLLSDNPVVTLDRALDACQPGEIVVVDDLESLLALGSAATVLPMLSRLRAPLADPTMRLVLAIDDAYMSRLEATDQELAAELTPIEVPSLSVEILWEIARAKGAALAAYHDVRLPDDVVRLAATPRGGSDRRAHPGLLTERLDHACARASLRPDREAHDADLGLAVTPEIAPLDIEALVTALHERVRGQDDALRPVAARVALTRAQLDLRPGRPDGVFLFVGPSGVGKTELARALCEQLFGDEQRLVRLDMSEYAEEWALSRLIGPQPGYVGFTEPESWLTTRIRRQPRTVLLLDEIEKAHHGVWNAFLQVFDAGRLSDSRGNVADFEHTVIAMTSNLGAGNFGAQPLGFGAPDDSSAVTKRETARVLDAVREALPVELVNRLDEVIVFQPLSPAAIEEIARVEIERMRTRLAERGYALTIADDVVALVATSGYDPAYGARHLQRNVERLLLEPLANLSERQLVAEVSDDRVHWRPAR